MNLSASGPVVDIAGLTKTFGRGRGTTRALDGLDLAVAPGEVAGFLGPNGAGKSTTLRILLGMIRADGGRARLFGADPWDNAVALHSRLAYVPGDVSLWPGLTGGQTLEALASLRRRRRDTGEAGDPGRAAEANRRRGELVQRFDLDPSKKIRAYSKGNRQKVALIAALSESVDLLVLDEPTSGLDPVMERRFVETIREIAAEDRTILLSSHIMSEVELLCHEVTIIRAGRAIVTDSLDNLRDQARVRIGARLDRPLPDGVLPGGAVHATNDDPLRLDLSVPSDEVLPVVSALVSSAPRGLTVTPANLDDLFWQRYEGNLR